MNMYSYVGNDPVNFTDPRGLSRLCSGGSCNPQHDGGGGGSGFSGNASDVLEEIIIDGQRNSFDFDGGVFSTGAVFVTSTPLDLGALILISEEALAGAAGTADEMMDMMDGGGECNQALINQGNQVVSFANGTNAVATGIVIGGVVAIAAAAVVSAPVTFGVGAVLAGGSVATFAGGVRAYGGYLQGRGGGGYQNLFQGGVAAALGGVGRVGGFFGRALSNERALNGLFGGALSSAFQVFNPGEAAMCSVSS